MDDKVKLRIMGISFNPVHNDAFALLLAEENGPMRIPVIIGTAEAQSIALRMEGIHPMRPMTHDLFCSFAHAFGARLREVFIYKFEDGVFYSEMTFSDGERQVVLDARTSDAVAIAMRTGAPIYTTHAIVEQTGIEIPEENNSDDSDEGNSLQDNTPLSNEPKTENLAVEELEKMLARLIADENYEEAASVSKLIETKRKRASQNNDATPGIGNDSSGDDDSGKPGFPFSSLDDDDTTLP